MRCHANLAGKKGLFNIPCLLRLFIIPFSFWLLLPGCHPMASVTIEVLEPGEVILPVHINKVAFINQSYIPSLTFPDSIPWVEENELHILDTIINYRTFSGLGDALRQSPLFDLEAMSILQYRRYDTTNFLSPLNHQQLDRIGRIQNADALISMEYYLLSGNLKTIITEVDFIATYQFNSSTYWRIYDLVRDTIIDEYMHNDSLIWEEIGDTRRMALSKLPLITDALREVGYHAGYTYGIRISPGWIEQNRYYHMKGDMRMREAAWLAASDRWSDAARIWREVADEENDRMGARACFNLALFYETEDLFDIALEWASKSYMIQKKSRTKEYIELLETRQENLKQLKNQLPASQ